MICCGICLDVFKAGDGDSTSGAPCGHVFHTRCWNQWLQRRNTCPSCQSVVVASDLKRIYLSVVECRDTEVLLGRLDFLSMDLTMAKESNAVSKKIVDSLIINLERAVADANALRNHINIAQLETVVHAKTFSSIREDAGFQKRPVDLLEVSISDSEGAAAAEAAPPTLAMVTIAEDAGAAGVDTIRVPTQARVRGTSAAASPAGRSAARAPTTPSSQATRSSPRIASRAIRTASTSSASARPSTSRSVAARAAPSAARTASTSAAARTASTSAAARAAASRSVAARAATVAATARPVGRPPANRPTGRPGTPTPIMLP